MKLKTAFILILFSFFIRTINCQESIPIIDSAYFESSMKSFAIRKNMHRYRFIKNYVKTNNLENLQIKTEAIDLFGIYRNVVIEKKGESDSIVYIVCHYDKVDGNIFYFFNVLINGGLDIILSNTYFSKGAYDNGSGVLTSLSLLPWINKQKMHYTYRFLFTGMEEYGLRGSRRHISGIKSDEWKHCFYAVNIDMVGKKGINDITVSKNVSDSSLVLIAGKICDDLNYKLIKADMPEGALSDYYFFQGQSFAKDFSSSLMMNMVGALIPQRSYFTKKKEGIPVINFTDDGKFTFSDIVSVLSPVAFGQIHSMKDNYSVVDLNNLVEYHNFLKNYLLLIDDQKSIRLITYFSEKNY